MEKEGISYSKAEELLKKFGENKIKKRKKKNTFTILLSQFTSPLIIILIVASLISWLMGYLPNQESNTFDTFLILFIVFASGISGFLQDYKAEKTIEELQKIALPKSKVIREGREIIISINKIVPGDLVLLEEGDIIPADCKLIKSFNLEVDESSLTGESKAINKKKDNPIYRGTFVNSGHGMALVLKTGMNTKLGKIAGKLQTIKEEKTGFQIEISKLSKKILIFLSIIIGIIFLISLFKYNLYESLLTSISLAVAAIPEGLPAVLVLSFAIGANIMAKKNALIRKLNVVETIGSMDIICTDKTGTLTKNEMSVVDIFSNNASFNLRRQLSPKQIKDLYLLFLAGRLCNNSKIIKNEKNEKIYLGDQTEIAIKKVSDKYLNQKLNYDKVGEISFSSKRKMMTAIYKKNKGFEMFSKGAPEILINKCNKIYLNGKTTRLTYSMKREILEKNKEFASNALRVLGFAFKEARSDKEPEKDLTWIGLQAMIDPPRKEVKSAIKQATSAGIRIIMMTGDNPLTAKAISKEIGLISKGVLTGDALEKLSDKELKEKLKEISIFARVSPFHKLRILQILKKDYRVAMTGDGVNDALALKKADVGISMGIHGTEVAKQASDIILLDDNFASIVSAIKEGRRSFENIRKFLNYLFVCNLAEVGVLFLATLFFVLKDPILLPVQLLWINLLTDGMPALSLGLDPARADIMKQPPRKKGESIINKKLSWLIGAIGLKKLIFLIATFFVVYHFLGEGQARTALFTGFILYEFVRIGTIRYQDKLGWWSNKWLLGSLFISVLLQITIIYTPLNNYFHIVPLTLTSWIILVSGVVLGYFAAILITKIILKRFKNQ